MKSPVHFLVGVFLLAAGSFAGGAAETNPVTLSATNSNDAWTAEMFGARLAWDNHVNGVDISAAELPVFLKGFAMGARNEPLAGTSSQLFDDVRALAADRQAKVFRLIEAGNERQAERFLQSWKAGGRMRTLPDGVAYEILQPDDGVHPKPTQTVTLHYIARLLSGVELNEFGPGDLILVTNHLNAGLFEGFQRVGKGGRLRLYLPPALAAHEIEMADAPRGSALVYEVELSAVKDTPADDLAAALVPAAPEAAMPGYSGNFSTNQVIEAWGWQLARQDHLTKMILNDDEREAVVKGFASGVQRKSAAISASESVKVDAFVRDRKQRFAEAFKRKQNADMAALFAKLSADTNVMTLPDGLRYKIIKAGGEAFPKPGQVVLVNYTGSLINGRVFDRTTVEPLHVTVGRVIPGWSEGIQKIGKGGQIRLYIPPALGYGGDAVSGIPADSTLIYDIDLLDIQSGAP